MSNPDEHVQEFSSVTEQELQIAENYETEIKNAGATHLSTHRCENHPNTLYIWGPTPTAVEQATTKYTQLQNKHTE